MPSIRVLGLEDKDNVCSSALRSSIALVYSPTKCRVLASFCGRSNTLSRPTERTTHTPTELDRAAYFSFLVLAATRLTEPASSTTPVLKLLLEGALRLPQAEEMEGLTAHLAEDKLHKQTHTHTKRSACGRKTETFRI